MIVAVPADSVGADSPVGPTLIDRYLAEQGSLTAVDRFARRHEAGLVADDARYRDLVPMAQPQPGQQYGFEVDLDACTGCKACVTACHSLNGLDEDESWRSVGLLHGAPAAEPLQQTVTTACHHCVEPACLEGCPVDAYEKDPLTGIVSHLDDQCIGCGYCTLTCPYEVPRFNAARGIVRKCDMCRDRLSAGEAPACVQACPNGAIRIVTVDVAAAVARSQGSALVPGAPPSDITVPTTSYRTVRAQEGLRAADHHSLRPAKAHPPLAVMLVLTQLAVGAFSVDLAARTLPGHGQTGLPASYNGMAALAVGLLALGASVIHLGRPRYAFRAVIGVRHSWLSREIVAFAGFAGLATAYAVLRWGQPGRPGGAALALGIGVAATGWAGVACSVMVYAVTRRAWWRARTTALKFSLTTVITGLAAVLATSAATPLARPLALALAGSAAAKLAWEAALLRPVLPPRSADLARTARLLRRDLGRASARRFGAGLAGGVALPLALVGTGVGTWPPLARSAVAGAGLVLVVAGELIERSQFFRAVTAPRMPGGLG